MFILSLFYISAVFVSSLTLLLLTVWRLTRAARLRLGDGESLAVFGDDAVALMGDAMYRHNPQTERLL